MTLSCRHCSTRLLKTRDPRAIVCRCGAVVCGFHSWQYIDANNGRITTSHPLLCIVCAHGRRRFTPRPYTLSIAAQEGEW